MFCKWCGNNVQITDKKCPTCGRETPPMSDCGGIYTLKSPGRVASPEPVVRDQSLQTEKFIKKYASDRKAAKRHYKMTIIGFAVLLIAVIVIAILFVQINGLLGEIKEQMEIIHAETMNNEPAETPMDKPAEITEDESAENPTDEPAETPMDEPIETTEDESAETAPGEPTDEQTDIESSVDKME